MLLKFYQKYGHLMWWNSYNEVHEELLILKNSLLRIEQALFVNQVASKNDLKDEIDTLKDTIDIFCNDEYSSIRLINDKLDILIKDEGREQKVELATKTLDKFDDYMKNVDKLNDLVNEFKGCVSLARGALEERRRLSEQEAKTAVLADMTREIQSAMMAFINAGDRLEEKAYFKLNAIYKAVCESNEKKSRKPRKKVKKDGVSRGV